MDRDIAEINDWSDNDFILNVMGYHHFHLGHLKEKNGHMCRTNEALYATVKLQIVSAILIPIPTSTN